MPDGSLPSPEPPVASTTVDGVVVLRPAGALDEGDVLPIARQARELLRPAGVHGLVVDLAGITFVDSSGLGLLVDLRRLADDRGAGFALRNVPRRVERLLELTGLLGYLAAE